ncbi:MAG TPA: hypothetical protein VFA53_03750 [Xanthobacteraceae bacterium]|nr:hypothetical protein [Xanthobacteraceae bacterium]
MFQEFWGVTKGIWFGGPEDGPNWMTMIRNWTDWKALPSTARGVYAETPAGPGIYEVRDVSNGDLVVFDAAADLATALASLWRRPSARVWKWQRLFGKGRSDHAAMELEYRIWPLGSLAEAEHLADWLRARRQLYWQRATGAPSASSAA